MADEKENGRNLDEILNEFCRILEKKVESIKKEAPDNVSYIEKVLSEAPLKHSPREIAEIIIKVSEIYLEEKSKEILDKANEKYLGKIPKHELIYKGVELYKASGKSTTDVCDDITTALNYLREKNLIGVDNGHVVLPLKYKTEEKK